MKNLLVIFLLFFFIVAGNGQVGIGTTQPHPATALHIKDNDRGILIPEVDRISDIPASVGRPSGLFVFNREDNLFYFYDTISNKWQSLVPLNLNRSTGIITPSAPTTTFAGQFRGNVNDTLAASGNNTFEGNGTIPLRGIIMWSGDETTVPEGWAICNGKIVNGIQTPDLRGRFVVGYINDDSQGHTSDPVYPYGLNNAMTNDYKSIGAPKGSYSIVLNGNNLPVHSHDAGHMQTLSDGSHSHALKHDKDHRNGSDGSNTVTDVGTAYSRFAYTNPAGAHTHMVKGQTRRAGGIYTYDTIPNPPELISGCTVWQYTCTTSWGYSFGASENFPSNSNTVITGTSPVQLPWATDFYGYVVTTPDGYETLGYAEYSSSTEFGITSCVENTGRYDSQHPDCVNPLHDYSFPDGYYIRINEKWDVKSFDNRPPYYVLAFIIRIK